MLVAQKKTRSSVTNCLSVCPTLGVEPMSFSASSGQTLFTSGRFRKDIGSFFISVIWKRSIGTFCESGFWG